MTSFDLHIAKAKQYIEGEHLENESFWSNPAIRRTINRDIAIINGKVNNMDAKKIRNKFSWFKYDKEADIEINRKLLKEKLAKLIKRHSSTLYSNDKIVPYYVVLDFEATCEAKNPPEYKHEIIEFPAVLVNSSTLKVEDTFQRFCRPMVKSKLSEFCIELTGITQEQVDVAQPFSTVLRLFQSWLESHELGSKKQFAVVSDGPWDMCRFLYVQCVLSGIDYPQWAENWVDIRKTFVKFYQEKKMSLSGMLEFLGMAFEGRPHCGLDDAKNIARVLVQLICDGAELFPNQAISNASKTDRVRLSKALNASQNLTAQLEQMSLEAERVPIIPKGRNRVYRDVKIERSKKIHALTKNLDNDYGFIEDGYDDLNNVGEVYKPVKKSKSRKGKLKSRKKVR